VGRDCFVFPLLTWASTYPLGASAADLLAFLRADEPVRELARELVLAGLSAELAPAELAPAELAPAELAPLLAPQFRPAAFRDCSLWEEHMIAASRGLLQLRE